jgi:hypothetical protein
VAPGIDTLTSFTALSVPVHLAGHPYGQSPHNECLCNNPEKGTPDRCYSEGRPAPRVGAPRAHVAVQKLGLEEEFNIVMFWQLAAPTFRYPEDGNSMFVQNIGHIPRVMLLR